jgi:hypothetical protein
MGRNAQARTKLIAEAAAALGVSRFAVAMALRDGRLRWTRDRCAYGEPISAFALLDEDGRALAIAGSPSGSRRLAARLAAG